jgi:gamma-glutamyltranspeptidase/glutathione hydrolase
MVASTHWLASAVGMAVLERGGNAFDAAVAAGFTLQVVEPHMNGPGGEVPVVFWPAKESRPIVLCGQGPAPAAATIDRYRSGLGLSLIPGTGLLAAVVPGAFDAWLLLLRDFGTLRLRDTLEHAIGYAEHGHAALPGVATAIERMGELFESEWTTSAELYLPAPAPHSIICNRPLAATYARIVREAESASGDRDEQIEAARRVWARGFVAEEIVRFSHETSWLDSSGERHAGLLAEADLATSSAGYEDPLSVEFRGHSVLKAGPWSQAPVFLQQLLVLDRLGLEDAGLLTDRYVHLVVESAKLAFADREAWYGDPDFVEVPIEALLSGAYADERVRLVEETASAEGRPGRPGAREPYMAALRTNVTAVAAGVGEPTRGDTCHLDVADRWGNFVSATPSGGWLHGSPVIPSLGFCLGTRAQMFWLDEQAANSLVPGKRPRTTLSPTLVLRGGEPYLATGTPGGDQQDQWTLNAFLAHTVFGLNLQEAVDAPSFHTHAFPSSFYPRETRPLSLTLEDRLDPSVARGLRERGHAVELEPAWTSSFVTAVARGPGGGLAGAASPRRMQAYVAGR